MDYNLLQQHTVNIYQLRNHDYKIRRVKARSLLKPQRFDLFAKLFYIKNVTIRKEEALKVYCEHIKAFNPDEHEPGREDKNGIQDFVSVFDDIINLFKDTDFDDKISIVPVDKNGVILDGAHRIATLAYYDKTVTVAQFNDVVAKCDFDYEYFKGRGLAWSVCDTIANEMIMWCDNLLVACLWPRMGNKRVKDKAIKQISSTHRVAYTKKLNVDLKSLINFVKKIYHTQSWTNNPDAVLDKAIRIYGSGYNSVSFVFFENVEPLENLIDEKERWRAGFGCAKDSLHVTDYSKETLQIADLVLTKDGLTDWFNDNPVNHFSNLVEERILFFKKVTWVELKSRIWSLLHLNICKK